MTIYITLFRDINVSGHNKIKMADLKQLFLDLGFTNVETYIQSGNVLFKSKEKETSKIEQCIVDAIENKFKCTVKVLVLTKNQIESIYYSNPFIEKIKKLDHTKLYATFLSNAPNFNNISEINKLINSNDDEFQIIDKTVYLYCPNGYEKTKLKKNLFEKKLNVNATTRNWKTTTKLFELSQQ